MEEELDAAEYNSWLIFYSLYDLPDAYFLAAKVGAYALGLEPAKVTPIYESDRPSGGHGMAELFAFAKGHMKSAYAKSKPPLPRRQQSGVSPHADRERPEPA